MNKKNFHKKNAFSFRDNVLVTQTQPKVVKSVKTEPDAKFVAIPVISNNKSSSRSTLHFKNSTTTKVKFSLSPPPQQATARVKIVPLQA